MTVTTRSGDIFESGANALVNPVNCVGVMGAGLAAAYKRRYPDMYRAYEAVCRSPGLKPGCLVLYDMPTFDIVSLPTKRHWRDKSRLDDIQLGLATLADMALARQWRSVAVPALGCGLGGLVWPDVLALIVAAFESQPGLDVMAYGPAH